MSDSDDEDCAVYGTPLEPIDEDSIPRKKPIGIEHQLATDKHGKRRFHGAFTGGFSAGFFNTVGSLEGWQPSTFKSTRVKKAVQKPEDFMDDEDRDEFGIAPTVLRAKPEYGGSRKNKRPIGQPFSVHPIPGEPVLKTILEPMRETVGVKLLMKMGWKPGQGVGPRLTKLEKKNRRSRVYSCAPPPGVASEQPAFESSSDSEAETPLDFNVMFAPDDCPLPSIVPKADTFGMGYSGLDRRSVLGGGGGGSDGGHVNLFAPAPPIRDKKNKLSISGQAFGVGAFEEEDSDIYAQDDMNQYDFALECHSKLAENRRNEKKSRLLAITGSSDSVLEGFVVTKILKPRKKYFPPPELPPGYVARPRTTRFSDQSGSGRIDSTIVRNSTQLSVADREAIVGEGPRVRSHAQDDSTPCDRPQSEDGKKVFRPFADDVDKQARYERFLNFVKIGAKDAFSNIQPKSMTEWEREKEKKEFEDAAKLYSPLTGFMAEKFTPAENIEDETSTLQPPSIESDSAAAAKALMFGKLTRQTFDWAPVSLLCKRFNIPPPWNTKSTSHQELANAQKKKSKFKFSLFDFLEASKHNQLSDVTFAQRVQIKEEKPTHDGRHETVFGSEVDIAVLDQSRNLSKEDVQFEDVTDKKDLFRAIFMSSSEDEDAEEKESSSKVDDGGNPSKTVEAIQTVISDNSVRNTSPPRGIFANLDLDSLRRPPAPGQPPSLQPINEEPTVVGDPMVYGPKLPTPAASKSPTTPTTVKLPLPIRRHELCEDEWVEKTQSEKTSQHKHKKHSHEKKDKHKHKKKKKKRAKN